MSRRTGRTRYNLPLGSTHGLSHKLTQMAYLRPHNRHSRYHNLYFVGASTHPGTGVPTVLISAGLAANRHTGGDDPSMTDTTARLARSITWASSKQSYLTARLLADRDLADDCLRAYAYFRWADDMIDISLSDEAARTAFIERQKALIDRLYRGERPDDLSPEEAMLADLIAHDRLPESGLHSFIHNFMAVIEFDAHRQGRLASRAELQAYTTCLATAVMDGLQYFIGNGQPYPRTHDRILAVTGAHITHMLRDMCEDLPAGLVNIPAEYLEAAACLESEVNSESLRAVGARTGCAGPHVFSGGQNLHRLPGCFTLQTGRSLVLCPLRVRPGPDRAGWFPAARGQYPERHGLKVWLEMARLGLVVTLNHLAGRVRSFFFRANRSIGFQMEHALLSHQERILKTGLYPHPAR